MLDGSRQMNQRNAIRMPPVIRVHPHFAHLIGCALAAVAVSCGAAPDESEPGWQLVHGAAGTAQATAGGSLPITLGTAFLLDADVVEASEAVVEFTLAAGDQASGQKIRFPVRSAHMVLRSNGTLLGLECLEMRLGQPEGDERRTPPELVLSLMQPVRGIVLEAAPSALRAEFRVPLRLAAPGNGSEAQASGAMTLTMQATVQGKQVAVHCSAAESDLSWQLGDAEFRDPSVALGLVGPLRAE